MSELLAELREEIRHREAVAEDGSSTAHWARDKPVKRSVLSCGLSMERMWSVYPSLRFAHGLLCKTRTV
jgi:hypothetical protein